MQEDVREKLSEVGSRTLEGLTVAEAAALLRQYALYEKLAAEPPRREPVPGTPLPLAPPVQSGGTKKRHGRLDETAVGKYLMTIAAAALCLLGIAVFAAGFWQGLPGAAKYAVILIPALAAWAMGYMKSAGPMRPFWLGVAGLGAGAAFLDFILGSSEWDLYGFLSTGVLCIAWTGACFAMARRRSAWLFHAIAYIGGFLAFWLSWNTISSFWDEALCGITAAAVLAMGAAAWRSNKKHWLLAAAWLAACWSMGSYLALIRWPIMDGPSWDHCYFYFCIAMACGSTWFVSKAVPAGWDGRLRGKLFLAALALGNAYFVQAMASSRYAYGYGDRSTGVLAAGILLSGLAVSGPGYLLGIAMPAVSLAAGAADGPGAITASVLAFVACAASARYRDKADRAGLALAWAAAASFAVAGASAYAGMGRAETLLPLADRPWMYAAAFIVLFAGFVLWAWLRRKNSDWSAGRLSWLAMLCGAVYVIAVPVELGWLTEWLHLCLAALSFNAFRRFSMADRAGKTDLAAWIGTLALSAVTALALTSECLFLGAFGTEIPAFEPAALTATLFLMAALDAYGMARSACPAQGVLACLAANWCLWLSAGIWTPGARTAVSVLGILACACFVAAGFRLDKKPARLAGLACALLYALKLGLYDASLSGGLGMAAGLLISGAGCFGISLLYNRLGKAMENKKETERDEGRK